jgi:hypothetical protein
MNLTIFIAPRAGAWRIRLRSSDSWLFGEGITTLKAAIDPEYRIYDPAGKFWLIDIEVESDFERWIAYCQDHLNARVIADGPERDKPHGRPDWRPEPRQISPYEQLCLTPDAPIEVVRAAKRALAILYHPDKPTGDLERMQLINDAADRIEKGRAA